jgi:hypothetical protein
MPRKRISPNALIRVWASKASVGPLKANLFGPIRISDRDVLDGQLLFARSEDSERSIVWPLVKL